MRNIQQYTCIPQCSNAKSIIWKLNTDTINILPPLNPLNTILMLEFTSGQFMFFCLLVVYVMKLNFFFITILCTTIWPISPYQILFFIFAHASILLIASLKYILLYHVMTQIKSKNKSANILAISTL